MFSCKKDEPVLPAISTNNVTEISYTTAKSGGTLTDDGGSPIVSKGVCWSSAEDPTIQSNKTTEVSGSDNFTSSLTGLLEGTTYYVRAYATNSVGTAYGDKVTFVTLSPVPTVTTAAISDLTQHTCLTGGTITSNGGLDITQYGVCWSTSPNPTIKGNRTTDGSASGTFTSSLKSLSQNTTYYVRAYATNIEATGYGNEITFTTVANPIQFNSAVTYGTVTDIDGNPYKTIELGSQIWMAENLKTTKYQNGDLIGTTLFFNSDISAESSPKYQWMFEGIQGNLPAYGRLYTWHVATDNRNVCPSGWHVPTSLEWVELINHLGGFNVAGGKLKETGLTHWNAPNTDATNETGFTALPGGDRNPNGMYYGIGIYSTFWTSYEVSATGGTSMSLDWNYGGVHIWESPKKWGMSIRCLKN